MTPLAYADLTPNDVCSAEPVELPTEGEYAGVVLRVVDADTVDVAVLLRLGPMRIKGIDAPEKNTEAGRQAVQAAKELVPTQCVVKLTLADKEKFGRLLGDVRLSDGCSFAETMLRLGHARPYDGGRRA